MTQFDWAALLNAGLRQLRLQPDEFWALTPAELRVMLGVSEATGPMRMSGLQELMNRYPDRPETSGEEGST